MRLFLLAGMVLLVACSDSSGPEGEGPADIEGTWTFEADISDTELTVTCTATGVALIEQSGSQFTGQIMNSTGTCSGPDGDFPFDANGALVGGTIDDDNVEFDDAACTYTGLATGDEIDGDVTCLFVDDDGEEITLSGNWQMTR